MFLRPPPVESFSLKGSTFGSAPPAFFENTVLAGIPDEVSHLGRSELQRMMQSGMVEPPGPGVTRAGRRPLTPARRRRPISSSIIPESFVVNETSSALTGQMLHRLVLRGEKRELMAGIRTRQFRRCHAAARWPTVVDSQFAFPTRLRRERGA